MVELARTKRGFCPKSNLNRSSCGHFGGFPSLETGTAPARQVCAGFRRVGLGAANAYAAFPCSSWITSAPAFNLSR